MTLTKFDKLNILYKSRAIKEMTIEDLEVWEGFDKIYPSYIRFPESIEFYAAGYCDRKKTIIYLKEIVKRIDSMIESLIGEKLVSATRDKRITEYLQKERARLNEHLIKLRKEREKRKRLMEKDEGEKV